MRETVRKFTRALDTTPGLLVSGVLLAAIFFCPYLVKGQGAFVLVHDNLDQVGRIPGLSNGAVDVLSFRPERLLFYLFGFFPGYVLNELLYRVIAFVGIFALLGRFSNTEQLPRPLRFLLSAAFTTLPFWPAGNLSVAGVPLVILLFVNLAENRRTALSLAGLAVFPTYSSLPLVGVFLILVSGLAAAYLAWTRGPWKRVAVGVLCLAAGYAVFHADLFAVLADASSGRSSRADFRLAELRSYGLAASLKIALNHFLNSQYHAHSLHKYVILPSSAIIAGALLLRRALPSVRLVAVIGGYLVAASLIFGMWYFGPALVAYGKLGVGFNFSRFYFLSPALWYLLWGVLLSDFFAAAPRKPQAVAVIAVLLVAQIAINLKHTTITYWTKTPTFAEFTAVRQFDHLKRHLRLGADEKVGCIGFHPSVANYNGLKTFGFYRAAYSATEKAEMREVIREEIEKSAELRRYFDNWGSRAYLFDDEIGMRFTDQGYIKKHIPAITCDLDLERLRRRGVRYLISVATIRNASQRGLREVARSVAPEDYYRLYLYALPDP